MQRLSSFILFLLLSLGVSAHEFYFAFAEIELDDLNGRVEATLTVTTHDLEKALEKNQISQKKLSGNERDSILVSQLQNLFNRDVNLNLDGTEVQWQLEGYDVQLNGMTHFYLSGSTASFYENIRMSFDLLMNEFSEQQNKATLIFRGKKTVCAFLPGRKEQTISLKDLK